MAHSFDQNFIDRHQADQFVSDFLKLLKTSKKEETVNSRIKSVLDSNAPIAELGEIRNIERLYKRINTLLTAEKSDLSPTDAAVLELQFLNGLRISEVLNISGRNINPYGAIHIKGLKGSSDRLVYSVSFKSFWLNMRKHNISFPKSLNRYYYYRLYKKKGLYEVFGNNKKASVTHLLRYVYLIGLYQSGLPISEIQTILGHRSIKSTIHYVENSK